MSNKGNLKGNQLKIKTDFQRTKKINKPKSLPWREESGEKGEKATCLRRREEKKKRRRRRRKEKTDFRIRAKEMTMATKKIIVKTFPDGEFILILLLYHWPCSGKEE